MSVRTFSRSAIILGATLNPRLEYTFFWNIAAARVSIGSDHTHPGRLISIMPLHKTEAFLLRSYALKEADKICVFLTKDQGKFGAWLTAPGESEAGLGLRSSRSPKWA